MKKMNKMNKVIATLIAVLMCTLTPLCVLASEDVVVAEDALIEAVTTNEAEADGVAIEEVIEEETEFTAASEEAEVNGDGDVLPGQVGAGFFQNSYNGLTVIGDDGKTILTADGKEIILTQRLVANYGFVDKNEPNVVYVTYMNGKVYWYCYKYQGTSGKMNRLGNTAINGYVMTNGVITGFTTSDGTISLLTDANVKEILGVDDGKKPDDSSSTKPDDSSSTKPDDSSSTKPDDSSSTKPDDSSSTKPDDSSSTKPDDSSSTKPDDSSSTKPDDSSSTKPDDSSSTKPDDGKVDGNTIKVISVNPAYGYIEVECLINGQKVTYRLNTGDYGEIQQAGITDQGIVYILFKNGKLVFWHPSMLKDLGQTTVDGQLFVASENCSGFGFENGVIYFYDSTGSRIVIPTIEQLKLVYVGQKVMYDYIVDNSVTNSNGYKTWTLLTRVDQKYYVVKHADSGIELKFDQVKHNRIVFNGKKYKALKASWSAGGDLFIKRGKNKIYVIRIIKKSDGTYKNKRFRFAKRAKDLHIDPATNLADYVVLRNGAKVSCVTGKKI